MDFFSPSSFCWLEFDENGALVDKSEPAALAALVSKPDVEDLVVISHGWKNDKNDATTLYGTLWKNTLASLTKKDPKKIVVCGILWPAKAYTTDFDDAAAEAAAGQALAVTDGVGSREMTDEEFSRALADFKIVFGARADATIAAAKIVAQKPKIEFGSADALVSAAKTAINAGAVSTADSELHKDAQRLVDSNVSADDLLVGLTAAPPPMTVDATGGTAGLRDTVSALLQGTRAAVARLLNQLTYFEMKKRAGIVGATLGSSVLPGLKLAKPVRLHLIGHSFGARLVTSAASHLPNTMTLKFFSLTLLQGAFSHNALAKVVDANTPGAFENVIGRPSGPISITHTHNDRACTFWYALASRLSRDTTTAFGDKDDIFGAMGANGAQKLAADVLAPDIAGETFSPQRGKVNCFLADNYIVKTKETDAHNNVTNAAVGKLVGAILEA
jgi:hypothetical protein